MGIWLKLARNWVVNDSRHRSLTPLSPSHVDLILGGRCAIIHPKHPPLGDGERPVQRGAPDRPVPNSLVARVAIDPSVNLQNLVAIDILSSEPS
jgi:hypothetical protein